MKEKINVFISSKMIELAHERELLRQFIPTIECMGFEFHPWIFEYDALPQDKSIRDVYLQALHNSMVYIGLFWNLYGEFTIDEFNQATERNIQRIMYVKDVDADKREPALKRFLDIWGDVEKGINPKWFKTDEQLLSAIRDALINWVENYLLHQPISAEAILFGAEHSTPPHYTLIGRDQLRHTILDGLYKGDHLLLQGMGGMGKTALMYTVLEEWVRQHKNAVWLKVGNGKSNEIFNLIIKKLDADLISKLPKQDLSAQQQFIRDLLIEHRIQLLVLDNVWNGQALSDVIGALPPHFPLLATARQRYSLKVIAVDELSDDDAVATLRHYAGADFPNERQKSAALELCRRLGNHPMALELAGIKLKLQADVPRPTIILKEIEDTPPHEMKSPDSYSDKERRTIKNIFDASLHFLDIDSRDVFLACGAFYVPQISEAMLALYVEKPELLHGCRSRLVSNGLLKVNYIDTDDDEIAVYQLHDLAYSYARAQATPDAKNRAQAACLTFAQKYETDTLYISIELNNLLGASQLAYVQKQTDLHIKLMRIIATKGYIDEYGHTLTLLARLDEAIVVARENRDDYLEELHYLLGKRATAYYERGELEKAQAYYHETAMTAKDLGLDMRYTKGLAMSYAMQSEMNQVQIAEDGLKNLEKLAREKNNPQVLVIVLEAIAYHYERHDNYPMCRQYALEQAELAKKTDGISPAYVFSGLTNWGVSEKFLGNPQKANELLKEALHIGEVYEMEQWQALASHILAEICLDLGAPDQSLRYAQQALALFESHGFTSRIADVKLLIEKVNQLIHKENQHG